jgi:hypothetical protein
MDENAIDQMIAHFKRNPPPFAGEKLKDQQIFDIACSFHEGALRCAAPIESATGKISHPTSPMVANYAFAAELYLKALLGTSPPRGHRLNVLFARLPSDTRQAAISLVQSILLGRSNEHCERDLLELANAFEEWRYIYEKGRAVAIHRLAAWTWALHQVCIKLHRKWIPEPYSAERLSTKPDMRTMGFIRYGSGVTIKLTRVRE